MPIRKKLITYKIIWFQLETKKIYFFFPTQIKNTEIETKKKKPKSFVFKLTS